MGFSKTASTMLQNNLFPHLKNFYYFGKKNIKQKSPLFDKLNEFVEEDRSKKNIDIFELAKDLNNLISKNKKILISNENWTQPTSVREIFVKNSVEKRIIFISNYWKS